MIYKVIEVEVSCRKIRELPSKNDVYTDVEAVPGPGGLEFVVGDDLVLIPWHQIKFARRAKPEAKVAKTDAEARAAK